jgi:hypothetical protein
LAYNTIQDIFQLECEWMHTISLSNVSVREEINEAFVDVGCNFNTGKEFQVAFYRTFTDLTVGLRRTK